MANFDVNLAENTYSALTLVCVIVMCANTSVTTVIVVFL